MKERVGNAHGYQAVRCSWEKKWVASVFAAKKGLEDRYLSDGMDKRWLAPEFPMTLLLPAGCSLLR
jgi:hypothetical protein